MHIELDELWMDALDMRVIEQGVCYLRDYHQEYRDTLKRQKEMTEQIEDTIGKPSYSCFYLNGA